MRRVAQILSCLGLVAVIAPPVLYLGGGLDLPAVKIWMLVGTIAWFVTVPLWMDRKKEG